MSGYLLDASVFIDAHRRYYPFDIRPDFWDWLERKHEEGFVFSIKKVYDELRASEDELSEWAEKMSRRNFFKEANDMATINKMKELRNWAAEEEFTREAVGGFYGSADILLVAYAKAHDLVVATNEAYNENIKKRVKVPNACKFIGVEYVNTFQLLGKVGVGRSVIAGYLQKLEELTGSEGNYAYRGQENKKWGVESGAFRRLKETNPSEGDVIPEEDFIIYHEDQLLEPARMDGHGDGEGRPLHDLELLAELQHRGTATCLIDFTRNFLVAMWFACQPYPYKKKEKDARKKQEQEQKPNGKIFILNTSDVENFLPLKEEDLGKKVRDLLKYQIRDEATSSEETTILPILNTSDEKNFHSVKVKNLEKEMRDLLEFQTRDEVASSKETTIFFAKRRFWWHWAPHGLNERILKQDSLFIFGQPKIEDTPLKEIEIKYEHKGKIIEELERLGITERTLFKDLSGFAESHGPNSDLPPGYRNAKYYFQKGNEALLRDNYEGAMADYNEATKLNSEYAEAYNNRGIVNQILGHHSEAKADYDRAIELMRLNIDKRLGGS